MCDWLKGFHDTDLASLSNTIFADQLKKKNVHIINHEQHISMRAMSSKSKTLTTKLPYY